MENKKSEGLNQVIIPQQQSPLKKQFNSPTKYIQENLDFVNSKPESILLLVSENSSSIESQDEQDFIIQEKILKHLVEPEMLYQNLGLQQPITKWRPRAISEANTPTKQKRSREIMRRENQTKYRMDSLNKAFECENIDTLSDDEIINVFNVDSTNQKNNKRTKMGNNKKNTKLMKKNIIEFDVNVKKIQISKIEKQPEYHPRLTIDETISLIDTQQMYNNQEYLSKSELVSSRLHGPDGIDAQQMLTNRGTQIEKRLKQRLYRQGLQVCEIVYNTLIESPKHGIYLGSKDVLFKMNLLNKKLRKVIIPNSSIFYLEKHQRLAMLKQKCQLQKQIQWVKNELKISKNDGSQIYGHLMDIVYDKVIVVEGQKTNMDQKVIEQIKCDLARTNTTERVKTKEGQLELERVLRASAYLFPGVGYCQGMNYVVSVLLHVTNNEEHLAFFIFIHFLQDKHLKMESLFGQGLPELAVMNYAFEKSIQKFCPKLFSHLRSVDMKTEYFTFKWSMTLFACFLPIALLVHIFDLFVLEGWPAIYKVGVSLLNNFLSEKLLVLDGMMEISQYLREDVRRTETYNELIIHSIIIGSHQINITKADIIKLKEEFYINLASQKIKEHTADYQDLGQIDLVTGQVKKEIESNSEKNGLGLSLTRGRKRRTAAVKEIAPVKSDSKKDFSNALLAQARLKLDAMDPHAKDDIGKFQAKLLKVDKQLDRVLKEKQFNGKQYEQIKDDFKQVLSKKKALQQTLLHIIDQYDATLNQMVSLRLVLERESKNHAQNQPYYLFQNQNKSLSSVKKQSNNNFAIIEQTMAQIENSQLQIDEQESELVEMNQRLKTVQMSMDVLKKGYLNSRKTYYIHKVKLEEQISHKDRVVSQMNGFLLMYELKRQEMLKDLSSQLKLDDVQYR